MRYILLAHAALFASPALSQTVDMSKFPAPAAGEFGPQAGVEDGINIAQHVDVDGQTHTDNEGAGDTVGSFRFICNAGQVNGDDSLIAFGIKGGAPHPHQAYGNKAWRYDSTYSSLRTSGTSTCAGILNRTGYWLPALISNGRVLKFDRVVIYYKRHGKNSQWCVAGSAKVGDCVGIPNGLNMIFGWDPVTGEAPTGSRQYKCIVGTGSANRGPFESDMVSAASKCQIGDGFVTLISAPECWDGVRLDSANHRDHVAYRLDNGQGKCPSTHPKLIPHFQAQTVYVVDRYLDRSGAWNPSMNTWYFSCDKMAGMVTKRPGTCVHQDYAEAWNPRVKKAWTDNCIDRVLSCSGGQLGNGYYLKPDEPVTEPNPRYVPVPLLRGGDAALRGHIGHTM